MRAAELAEATCYRDAKEAGLDPEDPHQVLFAEHANAVPRPFGEVGHMTDEQYEQACQWCLDQDREIEENAR